MCLVRAANALFFIDDLLLTEEALWISDRAQDEEGNWVFGHPTGVPHKNRKARCFECWMTAMQRDGEWIFRRGIEIYDQGALYGWKLRKKPTSTWGSRCAT